MVESKRIIWLAVSLVLCLIVVLAVNRSRAAGDKETDENEVESSQLVLNVPRNPRNDEDLIASVSVGVLPAGARIVVRTADGEIAGSIFPFVAIPGQKAGNHAVPIPRAAVKNGQVTLQLELVEGDSESERARAPTATEVEDMQLQLIPVTGSTDPV